MTKPMIRIHNTETDEIIDREMTDKEFESYQISAQALVDLQTSVANKAGAKAELLVKLGITAEEAALLLS